MPTSPIPSPPLCMRHCKLVWDLPRAASLPASPSEALEPSGCAPGTDPWSGEQASKPIMFGLAPALPCLSLCRLETLSWHTRPSPSRIPTTATHRRTRCVRDIVVSVSCGQPAQALHSREGGLTCQPRDAGQQRAVSTTPNARQSLCAGVSTTRPPTSGLAPLTTLDPPVLALSRSHDLYLSTSDGDSRFVARIHLGKALAYVRIHCCDAPVRRAQMGRGKASSSALLLEAQHGGTHKHRYVK